MDILALKEKRGKLWDSMKAFLDERSDISADDAAAYDEMEAEYIALDGNIKRLERQRERDMETAKPLPSFEERFKNSAPTGAKTGRASAEYRQAALTALRTNFRQINNELREGVAESGGYLVPTEWDSQLVKILEEENVFRRIAKVITTAGEHKINIQATRGAAYWVAEGAQITPSNMTFAQKTLDAHKVVAHSIVTNELF